LKGLLRKFSTERFHFQPAFLAGLPLAEKNGLEGNDRYQSQSFANRTLSLAIFFPGDGFSLWHLKGTAIGISKPEGLSEKRALLLLIDKAKNIAPQKKQ